MFFSVLEQFEITKFSFSYFFSISFFLNKLYLFLNQKVFFFRLKFYKFKRIFVKIFKIIQSFFLPNLYSTKNYTYSRLMSFGLKTYFKILTRRSCLFFLDITQKLLNSKFSLYFNKQLKVILVIHFHIIRAF